MATQEAYRAALNRVTKWRAHFAGWQLGTRHKDDPEFQAVAHHRELSIILRVEMTALTGLLLEKGVFTEEEFMNAIIKESDLLSMDYSKRWPGAKATDDGMEYNFPEAMEWLQNWRP